MRYFIELEYNGKNYHGWQNQPNAISVQEKLESTLSTLLREDIKIIGAGRTDTGVHAKQMYAHFDMVSPMELPETIFRLNSFLPSDIAVHGIFEVGEESHARFDALEREYQYLISLRKDPFQEEFAYYIHQIPDIDLMNRAAAALLEYTDFECFSRSNTDVKTYNCKIQNALWIQKDSQLVFTISADRFLRNMVRAIVGTLLEVGYQKIDINDFHDIIKSKDRSRAGASAPAHGLYLTKITYPASIKK